MSKRRVGKGCQAVPTRIVNGGQSAHPVVCSVNRDKLLAEPHHLLQILARFGVGEL